MPSFRNISELKKYAQSAINNALLGEVSELVLSEEKDAIEDVVYGVYNPRMYQRRRTEGGLQDPDYMIREIVSPGVLSVTNEAPYPDDSTRYNGLRLAESVILGEGYAYTHSSPRPYELPRDFIAETKRRLAEGDKVRDALMRGLRRQGLDVK